MTAPRQHVVATLWTGPVVVRAVDPAQPPSEAELDAVAVALTADNDGVRPVVRVLESAPVRQKLIITET